MNFLVTFKNISRPFQVFLGFALIAVVGIIDVLTGYEIAFSLFYLIPIALVTWFIGRQTGIVASFASAIVWFAADVLAGEQYSHPLIYIWNTAIRLGFFVIVTLLLAELKKALMRESELACTDFLTGALNSRCFFDFLQHEFDRCRRYKHQISMAYIDLDNFKTVNDRLGHTGGDQVLRAVVSHIRMHLRKTDVVARLGGDEFALLFPETGQEAAQAAVTKIQGGLLEEMQRSNWPITFSIGVVTCVVPPHTTDELVSMADELMYSVKREGKNAITYRTYAE